MPGFFLWQGKHDRGNCFLLHKVGKQKSPVAVPPGIYCQPSTYHVLSLNALATNMPFPFKGFVVLKSLPKAKKNWINERFSLIRNEKIPLVKEKVLPEQPERAFRRFGKRRGK